VIPEDIKKSRAAARNPKNDYPEIINPHKTSKQEHLFF
jgi:hypothetical protein